MHKLLISVNNSLPHVLRFTWIRLGKLISHPEEVVFNNLIHFIVHVTKKWQPCWVFLKVFLVHSWDFS